MEMAEDQEIRLGANKVLKPPVDQAMQDSGRGEARGDHVVEGVDKDDRQAGQGPRDGEDKSPRERTHGNQECGLGIVVHLDAPIEVERQPRVGIFRVVLVEFKPFRELHGVSSALTPRAGDERAPLSGD
jgi:hypothetical protein